MSVAAEAGPAPAWMASLLLHGGLLGTVLMLGWAQPVPEPPPTPWQVRLEAVAEMPVEAPEQPGEPVVEPPSRVPPARDQSTRIEPTQTKPLTVEPSPSPAPIEHAQLPPKARLADSKSSPASLSATPMPMGEGSQSHSHRREADGLAPGQGPNLPSPPSPTTTPTPPHPVASQQAGDEWVAALMRHLKESRRYPPAARRLGQEGVVTLRIELGADGELRNAEVHDSSGFPLLDQAAARLVREAIAALRQRVRPPAGSRMEIPVAYRLEG